MKKFLSKDFVSMAKGEELFLDKLLTFTRASAATRIHPTTGLVNTVSTNIARIVGRQELWKAGSKNLLRYSNDLQLSTYWSLNQSTTCQKITGDGHRLTFQAGDAYWGQYVTLPAGTYTLSAKVRSIGSSSSVRLQIAGTSAPIAITGEWTTVSRTAVWDSGNPFVTIREGNGLAGSLEVKEVQLELGSTATTYEPNPVVFQPGLLIEGQATNYIPYSDFSTGVGVTAGVTKTSDFATAPDGTVTAARVQYNGSGAAGSYRYYATADTATAGQKRVLSVWLKSNNGTPTIRLNDNNNSWASITLSSTWKRYYLPGSGQAGSAWQPLIFSPVGDNSAFDILVWGAQVEDGQFPTSLIPTSGAAVTRAADAASIDVSKIWNASEGTIVCEADFGPVSSAYQTILDMSGNSFQIYRTPAGNFTISSVATAGAVTRVRAATTALKLSVNGGQVVAGSKPVPAPATLFIGTNSGVGEPLNGTLQNLIYVPYAVDDLSLKSLSMLK